MNNRLKNTATERAGRSGMQRLRVLTYNVRRCLGVDGIMSPARIAAVIAEAQPDIIALQELDVRRLRSGGVDQAEEIARELGISFVHFHPALRVMEEEYGDAILTVRPSRVIKAGALPGLPGRPRLEPRGALWAAVQVGGTEVNVINTHLGLRRRERWMQAEMLLGDEWLGSEACQAPLVLTGDFNSFPQGRVYGLLSRRLRDAHLIGSTMTRPSATFPTQWPVFRIDHMFVSDDVEVVFAGTHRSGTSALASDHLPLVADLRLPESDQTSGVA